MTDFCVSRKFAIVCWNCAISCGIPSKAIGEVVKEPAGAACAAGAGIVPAACGPAACGDDCGIPLGAPLVRCATGATEGDAAVVKGAGAGRGFAISLSGFANPRPAPAPLTTAASP